MITVNSMGDVCPVPVVKTKNAIKEMKAAGTVEILVDNETSVQNLTKMANDKGYKNHSEKISDSEFKVYFEVTEDDIKAMQADSITDTECVVIADPANMAVCIKSEFMGSGDDKLGKTLMKAFLFALSQQDVLPKRIIMYNGGVKLAVEGADTLEDLKTLEALGVEIYACGTCLNFYELTEKLSVGSVTNMYSIVEMLSETSKVIEP